MRVIVSLAVASLTVATICARSVRDNDERSLRADSPSVVIMSGRENGRADRAADTRTRVIPDGESSTLNLVAQNFGVRESPNASAIVLRALSLVAVFVTPLALVGIVLSLRRGAWPEFTAELRPTHAIPMVIQIIIFAYWSLYWSEISTYIPVLLSHLMLAFLLDAVLSICFEGRFRLSLAPVPVTLSASLFAWFLGPSVHWGYVVIFIGLASKRAIRRNGGHIFNPSALGLAVMAICATLMPGPFHYLDLASRLNLPPNMSEVLLIAALIAQLRVPIVLVTIAGTIGLTLVHSVIPVVNPFYPPMLIVLLLLATDPATIPKTGCGRVLFGAFIAVGVGVFTAILVPYNGLDFWAKVLPIPLANLGVPYFDRAGELFERILGPRTSRWLTPAFNRNHVVAWTTMAVLMLSAGPIKRSLFERELHATERTRLVRFGEAGALPTCVENPTFCRPFSFLSEARLWIRELDH